MAGFKQEARIEDWHFYLRADGKRLCGKVYGHPDSKFTDGDIITTTPIVRENLKRSVVETRNTIYFLRREKK